MKKLATWMLSITIVGGLGAVGIVPRLAQRQALARTQAQLAGPRLVRTAPVAAGAPVAEITLPATSAPLHSTLLYAKSIGFLRKNHVDVGDRVKRGQLLAEIDAPETDEEIRLAQAQLEEATANVDIVKNTLQRNTELAKVGLVSREQADQSQAQANTAAASVKTRQAALQRLSTMRGYQRVVAPFDGVIAKRGFDPGSLVGGAQALFEVAQTQTLRVAIDVPQSMAAGIEPGIDAVVFMPSAPAQQIAGKVARRSGVLDPSTRTLRTEVQIPGEGTILPGAFVYVKLAVPRKTPPLVVPGSALMVRKEGTQLAEVTNGTIALRAVEVGRDLGREVEILAGIRVGVPVVLNPPDDLVDGMAVQVVVDPKPETKPDAKK
jgi:multidrug efflux system membrane fusion protein